MELEPCPIRKVIQNLSGTHYAEVACNDQPKGGKCGLSCHRGLVRSKDRCRVGIGFRGQELVRSVKAQKQVRTRSMERGKG